MCVCGDVRVCVGPQQHWAGSSDMGHGTWDVLVPDSEACPHLLFSVSVRLDASVPQPSFSFACCVFQTFLK